MKFRVFLLTVLIVLSCLSVSFAEEKITLSTFYPAPYGDYDELTANKMVVGPTYPIPTYDGDLSVQNQIIGGFGARTTSGTEDWNHVSNIRSGNGYTLLNGTDSNGPGSGSYFHPFNFEYNSKNGAGNMTQLAIPYGDSGSMNYGIYMRGRYSGSWTAWMKVLSENSAGNVGIGTTSPDLALHAVSGANNTSPFMLESSSTYDVFSILPYNEITYLSTGIYYKNGAWVHNGAGTTNALLGISGSTGGRWYASNNSTGSWNVASNVQLWNTAGVLTAPSSFHLKENFVAIDTNSLLQKIDQLEISRWNYKSEGASVTHIGPISEDFWQLFKTGDSDKSIALVDESGVALAGIKALLEKINIQDQRIEKLQKEITEIKEHFK